MSEPGKKKRKHHGPHRTKADQKRMFLFYERWRKEKERAIARVDERYTELNRELMAKYFGDSRGD